jgi:hypothetical protein
VHQLRAIEAQREVAAAQVRMEQLKLDAETARAANEMVREAVLMIA